MNTNPRLVKGSLGIVDGFCFLAVFEALDSMASKHETSKSCVKTTFLLRSCQSGRLVNYDPDAKCLQVRQ